MDDWTEMVPSDEPFCDYYFSSGGHWRPHFGDVGESIELTLSAQILPHNWLKE